MAQSRLLKNSKQPREGKRAPQKDCLLPASSYSALLSLRRNTGLSPATLLTGTNRGSILSRACRQLTEVEPSRAAHGESMLQSLLRSSHRADRGCE